LCNSFVTVLYCIYGKYGQTFAQMKGISKPVKYKHPRYKYRVFFPNNKGGRAFKAFKTLVEATNYYEHNLAQSENAGLEIATLPEKNRREYLDAFKLLRPWGVSVFEAAKTYAETMKDLSAYDNISIKDTVTHFKMWNKAKEQSLTLNEVYSRYIADLKSEGKSDYHVNSQKIRLSRFIKEFDGGRIASMIDANSIEDWIKDLKVSKIVENKEASIRLNGTYPSKRIIGNTSAQPKTKNNYRTALLAFFSYCKRKGYVQANPIERVSKIKESSSEPQIFSVNEIQKMLTLSPEKSDIRAYLAIGAFAGLRVSELARLTWDKIDISDQTIILDATITKTSTRRVVKMSDNLRRWLTPYTNKIGKKKKLVEPNFKKRFAKFIESNGIKWVQNGLRHSSASYYLAKSKNEYETAQQLGHSVNILKTHYMGLVKEKDATRYWEIRESSS